MSDNSVARLTASPGWRFAIDVGGTFTDCVGVSPVGQLKVFKTLSSGQTQGVVAELIDARTFADPARSHDPQRFWNGASLRFSGVDLTFTIRHHDADAGQLTVVPDIPASIRVGSAYEISTGDEAPILGIRHLLGLAAGEPIPICEVRLGTTRGTNALLERQGAAVGFVTTRGFGDLLLIGDQARPRLFELNIRKPEPLTSRVVEVDERLAADGSVLTSIDRDQVRSQLRELKSQGVESLAVALLHAYRNPVHELIVEEIAREVGFGEVVLSHRVSPSIKIVPRAESTVLDAYLNPILREYVERIEQRLGGGAESLLLMTSSGGLVSAERFSGKESVLSGPAGGAIGFSTTAQRAGFDRSIGFDMGGTSTDVSRFDGRFEMEYESRKAGVRIASPTLAIETVAAGGGSICGFDGVKLTVGPASAGSAPGPACYGRGGPLTITDCNLVLGRIVATRFPFPLDLSASLARLDELAKQIAASAGYQLTREELAEGLVSIANSHMARAIRRISVARGYDPQEYALAVFGGAGAQHACELASELGMRTVVVHPLASVLSAYGIACADETRHASRSLLTSLVEMDARTIENVFDELIQQASEGLAASDQIERSLELRYQGVETSITLPATGDVADIASRYEAAHEREFGFRQSGRGIEIVSARVTLRRGSGTSPEVAVTRSWQPISGEPVRVRVRGEWKDVVPWERAAADTPHSTRAIDGPALICESMTTLFVDIGYRAEITTEGSIVVTRMCSEPLTTTSGMASSTPTAELAPDPVRLEIFNNLFASIAEQMGETLRRTSVSTNVKERLDYSCALFDARGELIVNAPHIPVHLGAMSETVKWVLADNPDLQPGDVVLTNDPYRGGSHLPDLTVVTPVFGDAGAILFVVASRAHHAELGGIVPGSMPPFSRNLAEEGVLIRNLRVVRRGVFQESALHGLLTAGAYPSRRPADNIADVMAQIAANQTGVQLLDQLVATHTLPVVQQYMRFIREAAAAKVRQALAAIPDGEFRCVDHLDDGSPIAVTISIQGDTARVDFRGTGPVLATNLNANRAIVTSAVLYVFRLLIDEEIPLNGGVLIPVTIELPECLLNPPAHDDPVRCAAIVGGNVETSQRVVDVLLGALQLAAASQGTMNNLTFGDSSFGYYETICGGSGATSIAEGADAVQVHMTNTRLTDVELMEFRYPVRVRQFAIRQGSGGRGTHRGGHGIIREIEFLRPMTASILSQRRGPFEPPGLNGGEAGQLGINTLIRASGEVSHLGSAAQVSIETGDRIRIETPGGGGWGA
ncbi:MAG: hydantoinase B/oxoprolinase family protein [Planctomycetaceae bacterium]